MSDESSRKNSGQAKEKKDEVIRLQKMEHDQTNTENFIFEIEKRPTLLDTR